jgi:hypothetical protein
MEKRKIAQRNPKVLQRQDESSSSDQEFPSDAQKLIERKQLRVSKQIQSISHPLEKIRKTTYHILYGGFHPWDYIAQYIIVVRLYLSFQTYRVWSF